MSKLLSYRPPKIALALMTVSIGLWFFSPPQTLLYIPYKWIAGVSIILGFTILTWAWLQFRKSDTAVRPTAKSSLVVTHGLYKYSRNPMYLGLLVMLTGASLMMGTIPAMFAPIGFFIIIDKVFIPFEEEKLQNFFGDVYSTYLTQTRRWV
jgi:protein-S-isoprenylcysteine O-methyltransferase Ste14